MKTLYTILALALLLAIMSGTASGKSIKAYFNDQEATVSGIELHVGEQFTVDLYITPDQESYAYAEIDEPGVTRAYDRLDGDDLVPRAFKSCNASSAAHYQWVMAANENWLQGTAPLNIYYQIDEPGKSDPVASGLFTVVEAHIVPGEGTANETETPSDQAPESIPGPDVILSAACIILAAVAWTRYRQ